jgi:hypothetical protein
MVASLGETIVQDIPLINYSNEEWVVRASLTNENPKMAYFQGPKDVHIKPK